MKVCYLCFRAFSFARTTSITAGSMERRKREGYF